MTVGLAEGSAHYETDSSHTTWLPLSVLAAVDLIAIPGLCVLSAVDWLAVDWMTRAVFGAWAPISPPGPLGGIEIGCPRSALSSTSFVWMG